MKRQLLIITAIITAAILAMSSMAFAETFSKNALTHHTTSISINSSKTGVEFTRNGSDSNSTAKLSFKPYLYNGSKYEQATTETLEDYLYTFNKVSDGVYKIKADKQDIYFGPIFDSQGLIAGTSTPTDVNVSVSDGAFTFRIGTYTMYLAYWNTFNQNASNATGNKMYVYRYKDGIYEKVDSLEDIDKGGKFLIMAHQLHASSAYKGDWFAARPSTEMPGSQGTGRNKHLARVETVSLDVTGVHTGHSSYTVGDNTYNVEIHDASDDDKEIEVVTPENTPFVRTGYKHDRLSKLMITDGLTFNVNLSSEIKGQVTGVTWGSSDREYMEVTGSDSNGATLTALKPTPANSEVMLRVGYTTSDGTVEIKEMPVVIYPKNVTSNTGISNYYIQENTSSHLYVCFGMQPNVVTGEYMTELQAYEQIYMQISSATIDFFGKPESEDYALTYLGHNFDNQEETPGQFATLGDDGDFRTQLSHRNQTLLRAEEGAAMDIGCQGGFGYTQSNQQVNIKAHSDRLPELSKIPYAIESNGQTTSIEDINNIQSVRKDDIIYYKVIVKTFDAATKIEYGESGAGVTLKEELEGAYFVDQDPLYHSVTVEDKPTTVDITAKLNSDCNGNKMIAGEHVYYAAYQVKDTDVGRSLSNSISMKGKYKAQFSKATRSSSIEVKADKVQVVANSIRPNTEETVKLPQDITLPDGNKFDQNTSVQIHQIYFVRVGEQATLSDFAGENNLDCIGAVYDITTTGGENKTEMFTRSEDELSKNMLYTSLQEEATDFIVTYEAEDPDDTHKNRWMIYAVKIISKEDKFSGVNLTVGKATDINFFVEKYDKATAQEDARKWWKEAEEAKVNADTSMTDTERQDKLAEINSTYTSKNDAVMLKGIDFNNFSDDIKDYRVSFEVNGVESEPTSYVGTQTSGNKTLYKYTYKGLKPYEMGEPVTARLYHAHNTVRDDFIDESVSSANSYCEKLINTYKGNESKKRQSDAFAAMRIYGANSEPYAVERGWKKSVDPTMKPLIDSEMSGVTVEDNTYVEPTKGAKLTIESARLRFDDGMQVSLVTDFSLAEGENITDWNLAVHSNSDTAMSYEGQTASNGNIIIPGTRLSRMSDGRYRVTIVGISPFLWNQPYEFRFYKGNSSDGGEVTMSYSINSYFDRKLKSLQTDNDSDSEHLEPLLKAMYDFGNKARLWKYGQL